MTRTRALVFFAVAAVVVIGALVSRHHAPTVARDPHFFANLDPKQVTRVLHAAQAISASAPKAELVAQGEQLFESTAVAKQGESCAACHTQGASNPSLGMTPHPQSKGDFTGPRDPPALWGVAETDPYFWDGSTTNLNDAVAKTILGHFVDGASQPDAVTARQTSAIIAYLDTLNPPASSFSAGTMTASAQRGELLFQGKAGCAACHRGSLFTDNQLHNTGAPQAPGANDPGSNVPVPGSFNTPQLRDVRNTPPYMHNGVFSTLRQVVDFYDQNRLLGGPLNLTEQDKLDLVAYLDAL
jgi:cytochrome c peroxidase